MLKILQELTLSQWIELITLGSLIFGGIGWVVRYFEKKIDLKVRKTQEADYIKTKIAELEEKHESIMDENKQLREDLNELGRDFAQFVQKLLFHK